MFKFRLCWSWRCHEQYLKFCSKYLNTSFFLSYVMWLIYKWTIHLVAVGNTFFSLKIFGLGGWFNIFPDQWCYCDTHEFLAYISCSFSMKTGSRRQNALFVQRYDRSFSKTFEFFKIQNFSKKFFSFFSKFLNFSKFLKN